MLREWRFLSERICQCIRQYKSGGKWDLQTLWRVSETNIVLVNMTALVGNQVWELTVQQLRAGMCSLRSVACTPGCRLMLSHPLEALELSCRQPFSSHCAAENFLEPVMMKAWSFIFGGPETPLSPNSQLSHLVNTWVWVSAGHLLKFLEQQRGCVWGRSSCVKCYS